MPTTIIINDTEKHAQLVEYSKENNLNCFADAENGPSPDDICIETMTDITPEMVEQYPELKPFCFISYSYETKILQAYTAQEMNEPPTEEEMNQWYSQVKGVYSPNQK